jgi:two-component system, OmpR family, response regulator
MLSNASTRNRVLIVEDDQRLAQRAVEYFGLHQTEAHAVGDLASARALLAAQRFDLVILDLNLGADDGLVLGRELAERGRPPVIITSGRSEEADRVLGLELGAHDYVVKPYSLRELIARARGVIRRANLPRREAVRRRTGRFDEWSIDLASLQGRHTTGRVLQLTAGELGILRAFLDHPHRVLSRNELLELTRRDDAAVFSRTVDVLVTRLRKKIEADPRRPRMIRTVRGEGYRFECDVEWEVQRD